MVTLEASWAPTLWILPLELCNPTSELLSERKQRRTLSVRRQRGQIFSLLSGTYGFKQHLRHILQLLAWFTAG
ncbi:hypothetical protein DNTS_025965 [Danionella cerebrum]|uniref:Uncharacterized protein n=1 Tax=Danionella cerebrum TaxID=2873325 RepID=A0A553R832_9TELE|nr:hypothetical protein DNTS_025965 [Danionella translucida]